MLRCPQHILCPPTTRSPWQPGCTGREAASGSESSTLETTPINTCSLRRDRAAIRCVSQSRTAAANNSWKRRSLHGNQWAHVAVTLGGGTAKLYVNGELKATKSGITIKPSDIKPSKNYIGKSQFPDPLFNGMIDEFRVYNLRLKRVTRSKPYITIRRNGWTNQLAHALAG